MASDVIDFALQMLVDRDILQGIPSWELLKDNLAQQCFMAPDRLEAHRSEIVEKFVRCKHEQIEKAFLDLMGTTSIKATSASTARVSLDQITPESAGPEQRPNPGREVRSKGEEDVSEPTFHPEIDEKLSTEAAESEGLQSETGCFMSIYLPNGKWEGAAAKYCKEEESYVSLKIIDRHKLDKEISKDGHVRLTWRLYDEEGTNVTQFTVQEGLLCDFMLGTRRLDEDFNRDDSSEDDEDAESASSLSKDSEPMKPPLPQMYSLSPNPHEFAKLVGLANAESIAALMRETAITQSVSHTLRQGRQHVDDVQSAPSLVPSSRRPRLPKKDPATAVSVEASSGKRHNTQR